MDLDKLKLDLGKANEGVWMAVGDCKLLIAAVPNPRYTETMTREFGPLMAGVRAGMVSESQAHKVRGKVYGESVWLGLKGELLVKGQPFVYTPENAGELLGDEEYVALFNLVDEFSKDEGNFRIQREAKVLGNLPEASEN
jgi:hypothetical protein